MRKAAKVGIAVAIVAVAVIVAFFGANFLLRSTSPVFNIVSHNDDIDIDYDENFNPIYTMTIYVKIENWGIDGSKMVYCEVSREDLTTCTKSQIVFIEAEKQKIISFVFKSSDLKGACPAQYKVWID